MYDIRDAEALCSANLLRVGLLDDWLSSYCTITAHPDVIVMYFKGRRSKG